MTRTSDDIKTVFKDLDRIIWMVLGALLFLYVVSGTYVIEANQMGVVFRFGAESAVVPPGIGWRLPWPVETVKKVNVREVQTFQAGFAYHGGPMEELPPYCITGDKNIIHNTYKIQYRIGDPAAFLMASADVNGILYHLTQATILESVAEGKVDELLTTGKRAMELTIRDRLIKKIEELKLGIQILSVEGPPAEPPNQAKQAFQDVVNAIEEKKTKVHEAENYQNQELPKAKAEANRIIQDAQAYKVKRISAARGESDRFIKIFDEYRRAPAVTRNRMFIETVEQVLPRTKVMVLATDKQGRPIRVKILQAPIPTTPRLP